MSTQTVFMLAKCQQQLVNLLAFAPWAGHHLMEECPFKNVNNYLNINTYSYLETSGGQSSNLYLNLVHFLNTSVN